MSCGELEAKILLVGKTCAGKTALLQRYAKHYFGEIYQCTIGMAFKRAIEHVDGHKVKLNIWDTAGLEQFHSLAPFYFRGAAAAIVCYDVMDAESWSKTDFWIKEVLNNTENCHIYLKVCATKMDLLHLRQNSRVVPPEIVKKHLHQLQPEAAVFEISAKTGQSVRELFQQVAQDYNDKESALSASICLDKQTEHSPRRSCCSSQ